MCRNLTGKESRKLHLPWVGEKRPNPWNLVFEKFCASKTEEDMKGLEEARDNFLQDQKKLGLLDYPFGYASSQLYCFHFPGFTVSN